MTSSSDQSMRLQKFIAQCGVTSRRKAEELIVRGEVKINGRVSDQLGVKVNPQIDVVEVSGQLVDLKAITPVYLVLNKPRAIMTTLSDPEGRPTVMDYVKEIGERIYPVGRLDYLSEGLLLMTNDGDFAQNIIHPSNEIEKVYEVKVFGHVSADILKRMMRGVDSPVGFLKPRSVRVIGQLPRKTWIEFRLIEGKNREIRRLCEAFDLTIDKLRRVAIGDLTLSGIKPGSYKLFSKRKIEALLGKTRQGIASSSYVSHKKSVKIKKRVVDGVRVRSANDEFFHMFRKENYKETLKGFENRKSKKPMRK